MAKENAVVKKFDELGQVKGGGTGGGTGGGSGVWLLYEDTTVQCPAPALPTI